MSIKQIILIIGIVSIVCLALLLSGCCGCMGNQVTPKSQTTLWDETKQVLINHIEYYHKTLNKGDTINIDVQTNGGAITFLVIDSANFPKYYAAFKENDLSAAWSVDILENNVIQKTFTYTVPATDDYYIVLDNSGWIKGSILPSGDVNVKFKATLS